jgi:hypothetical protein
VEVGLEMNGVKSKSMLLSGHQNEGQNLDIKIAKRSFENISQFKSLGANQNLILGEIKSRINCGLLAAIQSRTFCLLVCCQEM